MAECPVCKASYVKGKSERCHTCGWQLNAAGFSMIGPVKIEHQLSRFALTKIEAWARHMWTKIQQQKQQITQLQHYQLQHPPVTPAQQLPTVTLPSEPFSANLNRTLESVPAQLQTTTQPAPDANLLQWILSRLEVAVQERAQLKFQLSQLRAEVQKLQTQPVQSQPLLNGETSHQSLPPLISGAESEMPWQDALADMQSQLQTVLEQQQSTPSRPVGMPAEITPLIRQVQELGDQLNGVQIHAQQQIEAAIAPLNRQLQDLVSQFTDWQAQPQQPIDGSVETKLLALEIQLQVQQQATVQLRGTLATLQNQHQATFSETIVPFQSQLQQQFEQLRTHLQQEVRQEMVPAVVQEQTAIAQQQLYQQQSQQYQVSQALQAQIDQLQMQLQQLTTQVKRQTQEHQHQQSGFTDCLGSLELLTQRLSDLEQQMASLQKGLPSHSVPAHVRSSHTVYTRYH